MKTSRTFVLAVLFLVLGSWFLDAEAAPPQLINYQGRLVDGTNLVSGQLSVVLRVYTNATMGDYLFEDSNNVTVVDGLYSTPLGAHPLSGSLTGALAGAEAWIEVEVNGTILSPREQILSAAYALNADKLDGVDSAAFATSAALTSEQNARVAADGGLGSSLASETAARIGADSSLSGQVSVVSGQLATETGNRIGADASLSGQVSVVSGQLSVVETGKVSKTGDTMTGALVLNVGANTSLVISSSGDTIVIGKEAVAADGSIAVGGQASGFGGATVVGPRAGGILDAVAIGLSSYGSTGSVAVGHDSEAHGYGVGMGANAWAYNEAVSIGHAAHAYDEGVGIGFFADGQGAGVAVGSHANASSGGLALGVYANGWNSNIAMGAWTRTEGGTNRIAIGNMLYNEVDDSAALRGTLYLDGGTGVLYRSTFGSGEWTDLKAGLATGTPLYAYTESDPVWNGDKANYATTAALGTETADRIGADTSLSGQVSVVSGQLSVETNSRIGADASLSNQLTTVNGQLTAVQTGKVSKTGDTMTGALTIDVSVYSQLVVNSHGSAIQIGNNAWVGTGDGVAIGRNADGEGAGVAIGTDANGRNFGVGIGVNADGSYESVAIGDNTYAEDEGTAIGYHANAFQHGVALGHSANGFEFGISIGLNSTNTNSGIGIGYRAKASHKGIAIGGSADATGAYMGGSNRIAIGNSVTNAVDESARIRGTLYLDGGTGVYVRSTFGSGAWANLLDGVATGTPLYAYTESDPVWNGDKANYATTAALGTETADRIGADTSLSGQVSVVSGQLSVETNSRIGADASLSNQLTTVNGQLTAVQTGKVSKTGDTMTGTLTVQTNVSVNYGATRGSGPRNMLTINGGDDVEIGSGANGYNYGAAAGYQAAGGTDGAAFGYQANGYFYGAAFGRSANGYNNGAALGHSANGNNGGAAAGLSANGINYGSAMGRDSRAAEYGAAMGYQANGANAGAALGYRANGANTNIAIGASARASGGTNRIAIGQSITNTVNDSAAIRGTLYLDGGTGVYYRSTFGSGTWIDLLSGLATGTPLYAFTESDPLFSASVASAISAVQTGQWSQAYDWGNHASAGYATGTPVYAETDPTGTGYVQKVGDTMTGKLTITVSTGPDDELVIDSASGGGVSIGRVANGYNFGAAIGYSANGYTHGAAVGDAAIANNSGAAVGYAANGSSMGAAVGSNANGYNFGAAMGFSANGSEQGSALGNAANGYNGGVGVGVSAYGPNNGVAVGGYANGYGSGVGVGAGANAYDNGTALGTGAGGARTNIAIGMRANAAGGSRRIAIGHEITNQIDNSAAIRGTLYLDGGTGIYYRSTFGSGGWTDLKAGLATGTPLYAFTETDPLFSASVASAISAVQTGQWSQAYGWGDHGAAGYATGTPVYAEADPVFGLLQTNGMILGAAGTKRTLLQLRAGSDQFSIEDTDGPADENMWLIKADNGALEFVTSADSWGSWSSVMSFTRDGATPTNVRIATSLTVDQPIRALSDLRISGEVKRPADDGTLALFGGSTWDGGAMLKLGGNDTGDGDVLNGGALLFLKNKSSAFRVKDRESWSTTFEITNNTVYASGSRVLTTSDVETEVVPYEFGMATNNAWRNNTGGADYEWDNLNLGLNAYDHGTSGVVSVKVRVFAFCDGATNLWVGVRNNTDSTYPIGHTQTAGLNNSTPQWWESGWTTVTNTTGIKELRVTSYTDESGKWYFIKKAVLLVKYQKKFND